MGEQEKEGKTKRKEQTVKNSQVNVKKSVEKIPTKLGRWFSNHWDVHFKKNNYYPKVLFC